MEWLCRCCASLSTTTLQTCFVLAGLTYARATGFLGSEAACGECVVLYCVASVRYGTGRW